jgi:hypothetical protein
MLMAARKLQSIGLLMLVTICALAAYPVSLHVASTRTELRRVESDVLAARRRIRMIEGEIAVLANMGQLERWNADSFGYLAPAPGQYLAGERALASIEQLRPAGSAETRAPILVALQRPVRTGPLAVDVNGDTLPQRASVDASAASRTIMRDIARTSVLPQPVVASGATR